MTRKIVGGFAGFIFAVVIPTLIGLGGFRLDALVAWVAIILSAVLGLCLFAWAFRAPKERPESSSRGGKGGVGSDGAKGGDGGDGPAAGGGGAAGAIIFLPGGGSIHLGGAGGGGAGPPGGVGGDGGSTPFATGGRGAVGEPPVPGKPYSANDSEVVELRSQLHRLTDMMTSYEPWVDQVDRYRAITGFILGSNHPVWLEDGMRQARRDFLHWCSVAASERREHGPMFSDRSTRGETITAIKESMAAIEAALTN